MGQNVDETRVTVTGLGVLSCIGNSQKEVIDSLQKGHSGIVSTHTYVFQYSMNIYS